MNKEKNNKAIIIFVGALVLVALIVIILKVIDKGGNDDEIILKPNEKIEERTIKTNDGNKVLKIFSPDNEEMNNRARKQLKDLDEEYDESQKDYFLYDNTYLGEYNGDLVVIYDYNNNSKDKYSLYISNRLGEDSQCGTNSFVINNETNELLDLNYDEYNYDIEIIFNKYHILEGNACNTTYGKLYSTDLTKIADSLVKDDEPSYGYFYGLVDGYLTKFDKNDNIVKKGTIKFDNEKTILGDLIGKEKVYSIISINNLLYLYDFNSDTKYKIYNGNKSILVPYNDDAMGPELVELDNKLMIILYPDADNQHRYTWTHFFDLNTKKFDFKGYYITEDNEITPKYFYIWNEDDNGNNKMVYKYDYKGNVIDKVPYDGADSYKTDVTHEFAYDGNLYIIILEDDTYYLEDVFANQKYELVDSETFEYSGYSEYYTGDEVDKYTPTKIELTMINRTTKKEQYVIFDMNDKTIYQR